MKKLFALSTIALAISGCSDDTLPDDVGNSFGQLELNGTAEVGQTLTASVTDGNGVDASAITYTWSADGTTISGATSSTLTLTSEHAGAQISVTVSYTDNDAFEETIVSDSTSAVLMNVDGTVAVSGTLESGRVLTATVADDNGLDETTVTFEWLADGAAIAGATAATYTLTDDEVGKAISVTATYTDSDGFSETVTSSETAAIAAAATTSPATFAGDQSATVANNASQAVSGTLSITDTDAGEDMAVAQTDAATMYGTFSITTAGEWSYTVNTAETTVAALDGASDTLTDTITVESVDGTTAEIVVTITGVDPDKVAKISDSDTGDTGELYYSFDSGLTTGKLALSFLYGEDEEQTAYISLYDTEGSTKSLIGELILNDSKFGLRLNTFDEGAVPSKNTNASSSIDYDAIDAPDFTPGQWIDIVMMWDTSSTTEVGTYTVVIDGETYGPFDSQHPTPGVAVESMTVRLADNGKTSTDAVYVNDLAIYSDVAGTTAVLEEDFEGYTVGDSLEDSNDSSPFGSRTFEAVVAIYGEDEDDSGNNGGDLQGDDVAPGTSGNQIAVVGDTMTDDAGELRYKLSTSDIIQKGRMTASFNKSAAADCTFEGNEKDAYIAVYGSSTSSYNAIVDLRMDGSDYATDYALRHKNEDGNKTVELASPSLSANTWTNIEVTWDATAADDSTAPLVNISLDGTAVASEAWSSYSESLSDVASGAQTFVFKLGDTSANVPNCEFKVDNIKIYSIDGSDAETLVFADNFESYTAGASLDTDNDASPYNSSTAEATVGVED